MYQYILAFLLINSYYQSLGIPLQPSLSNSLTDLASICENKFLSSVIKSKIKDCSVSVPPFHKKQIRCLIFYDINKQLCSAIAGSKLAIPVSQADYESQILPKQEVNTVCMLAKDWVFTNLTEYPTYKNISENLLKLPATCGEICGVEDVMNEANEICKYYKWGLSLLKSQVSTIANMPRIDAVDAPIITDPDPNAKADIAVPINSNQVPQGGNTKTFNVQIKQTDSSINKTTAEETAGSGSAGQSKSIPQTTSKQTVNQEMQPTSERKDDADLNVEGLEHPINLPDVDTQEQANKSTVSNANQVKNELENDPAVLPESGKELRPNLDAKEVVLEKAEGKPPSDPDDYADSEGNDGDDDGDDQGLDIKSGPDSKQDSFVRTKLMPSHNADVSHKEYYPNPMADTFSDDGDHFFPFFLTAVILVVLLYILYHNKSKVSKVFFGLILEGRQGSRRRNSRGHAYRRLDTLEQAMSANTAAPPSKIIY